jgi:DNA-binding beta-propeller fold protein YncE
VKTIRPVSRRLLPPWICAILCLGFLAALAARGEQHLLYAGVPGIRDELQYGGHGVLVFDIDNGHRFVQRIPTAGLGKNGKPLNVKGICASAVTKRLYLSTIETLICMDLLTEKVLWERRYDGGCDRMALAPDGQTMFLPSLEKGHWHLVDAMTGDVIKRIEPKSGAHNTIYGLDGAEAYLAGLKSPELTVVDTKTREVKRTVGPFGAFIRPFTVNGRQTLCFVNVNDLLGFEIGDLKSGKFLERVEVSGFQKGATKRHGCPCHGIGLTPDERELWLADSFNRRLHVFDATVMPPKQLLSIALRDEPGWVTFTIDGRYAYPSTGDVVDTKTHKVVTGLRDEEGREVQSEKVLEIDFEGKNPVRAGDQFGLGRVTERLKAER